jgi:hypothetical protein
VLVGLGTDDLAAEQVVPRSSDDEGRLVGPVELAQFGGQTGHIPSDPSTTVDPVIGRPRTGEAEHL